jgi:hypothetical protein
VVAETTENEKKDERQRKKQKKLGKVTCQVCNEKVNVKKCSKLQKGGTGFSGHDGEKLVVKNYAPTARV